MSRLAERKRRRDRLAGVAIAVLGAFVLVVAVIALQGPKGHDVSAGSKIPGSSGSHSAGAPRSTPKTTTHPATTHASTTPSSGRSTSASTSTSSADRLSLVVLNNTTIQGLAQQAAQRFTQGGWTVTRYANYTNDIVSTCAYYDPSVDAAKQSAQALQAQYPTIKRVEPQFAQLSSYASPIVVILTPDYSPD